MIASKDITLLRNVKEVYKDLTAEMAKLNVEKKITSEQFQLYMKILGQDEKEDTPLDKEIRSLLLVYANDKNLDTLKAKTELLLMRAGMMQKPAQVEQKGTGHCILKVIAGNDLAKEGTVYVDEKERGKLKEGVLEVLDLSVGKHVLVVDDAEKINRWEKEVGFTNDYEIQEARVIAEASKRFVRVVTEPTEARVWIDGMEVGTSTWQGRLEVGNIYEIRVSKEGYSEEVRKINVPGKGELIEIKISMQLIPNSPPTKPSNLSPWDGAVSVSITPLLSWVCSDPGGDSLVYDIYFGTNPNPPLVKSSHTSTVYNPGSLSYSTTYYWRVVAKDSKGGTTYGDVWRFTTMSRQSNVGALKWRYSTGDWVSSNPVIGMDGTIYVGSRNGYIYAVNPNGTLKWRYQTGGRVISSPAIGTDGTIYVGSRDDYIYALNANGTLKWKYTVGSYVDASPAVGANGTIYVGSSGGRIYVLNPNGTLRWEYQTGDAVYSSPTIAADGTIYVGSSDGYLYAIYSDSQGLVNSPWPKFRGNLRNTGKFGGRRIQYDPYAVLWPWLLNSLSVFLISQVLFHLFQYGEIFAHDHDAVRYYGPVAVEGPQ